MAASALTILLAGCGLIGGDDEADACDLAESAILAYRDNPNAAITSGQLPGQLQQAAIVAPDTPIAAASLAAIDTLRTGGDIDQAIADIEAAC